MNTRTNTTLPQEFAGRPGKPRRIQWLALALLAALTSATGANAQPISPLGAMGIHTAPLPGGAAYLGLGFSAAPGATPSNTSAALPLELSLRSEMGPFVEEMSLVPAPGGFRLLITEANTGQLHGRVDLVATPQGGHRVDVATMGTAEFPASASPSELAVGAWLVFQSVRLSVFQLGLLPNGPELAGGPDIDPTVQSTLCMPHDMTCSFPWGKSDRITVQGFCWFVPSFTVKVDVGECCREHDKQLWCDELSVWEQIVSHNALGNCIAGKILSAVTEATPWYCGGVIVGAIAGAAQAVVADILVTLASTAGTSLAGDDVVGGGVGTGSCLCGGTRRTTLCDTGAVLCRGLPAKCQ